ncbi:MAG TPA: hypothetical protein VF459_16160 [Caulobacteraceae bacterium]
MLFLLNDVVLDFEIVRLAQPAVVGHLARLPFEKVSELVREAFARNPRLLGGSITEAHKLALMISLKQPQVNAARALTPGRVCQAGEVTLQFACLGAEVLYQLKGLQDQRRLTSGMVNTMVWSRADPRPATA